MKQKTIVLIALMIAVFSFSGAVLAQEEAEFFKPGLTPLSPFYFLDRFGDWARVNILTFNPVRKAEIKTEIVEERLAELNDVSEKAPARADILEELEAEVETGASEANSEAEKLDSEKRDVSKVVEMLHNISLKRQEVLEKAIERVPDKVKDKIAKRLEDIHKQFEKRREILLKQREKGFISEEKMTVIIQDGLSRLKNQLEERKSRLENIKDEAIKERMEKIVKDKIEALESDVLDIESRDEFKEARRKIIDLKKETIKSILEARKGFKLTVTTTEEVLKKIQEDKLNLKEEAEKIIREVEENIREAEEKLSKLKAENISAPQNINKLVSQAKEHLKKAKAAFEESRYGEAFGQATAGWRNIRNARESIERILGTFRERSKSIAPKESEGAEGTICAQVITPARNIKTKKCRIFRNSCLPAGWERDTACEKKAETLKETKEESKREKKGDEAGQEEIVE